jgi:hypothetical protein
MHIYNQLGKEVGILGPAGWIAKHGFDSTAPSLPFFVRLRVNGRLIEELRRFRVLPPKGFGNIKGAGICRTIGKVAKVALVASVVDTLLNDGIEAAVLEAADDLAWPIPISAVTPQDQEEHEFWSNVGSNLNPSGRE